LGETKRNETKRNETKRNETKRNETKRNETKRNETKRNETKRNGKNRFSSPAYKTKGFLIVSLHMYLHIFKLCVAAIHVELCIIKAVHENSVLSKLQRFSGERKCV
jgi:hypothetical protein